MSDLHKKALLRKIQQRELELNSLDPVLFSQNDEEADRLGELGLPATLYVLLLLDKYIHR